VSEYPFRLETVNAH